MMLCLLALLLGSVHVFAESSPNLPLPIYTNANASNAILLESKDKIIKEKQNLWLLPHEYTYNDKYRLNTSTKILLGGQLFGAAFLFTLPESTTNWDKDDVSNNIKWWDHVGKKPVWDKDGWFVNYVTHPYWGAIYYVQGRSAGYNKLQSAGISFVYSALWEYGIEAFAERPSVQDLVITPLGGTLFGEIFFTGIKSIQKNNYKLLNSTMLGKAAVFIMDPLHFVVNRFHAKNKVQSTVNYGITSRGQPMLSLNITF